MVEQDFGGVHATEGRLLPIQNFKIVLQCILFNTVFLTVSKFYVGLVIISQYVYTFAYTLQLPRDICGNSIGSFSSAGLPYGKYGNAVPSWLARRKLSL